MPEVVSNTYAQVPFAVRRRLRGTRTSGGAGAGDCPAAAASLETDSHQYQPQQQQQSQWHTVTWIDSKATFGDDRIHAKQLQEQYLT
jgi:hypothetical protein